MFAVLSLETVGAAEYAAEVADVLTEYDDVRILVHYDIER
jgi:hypothetical protein